MLHVRHHSVKRALLLALLGSAALAGCSGLEQQFIGLSGLQQPGVYLDRPPPPVTVVRDGPAGELIAGAAPPLVPDAAVDLAVAEPLRPWLTAVERRNLAEASQVAAAEFTLKPVGWEATDPTGAKTAAGAAVAVSNVYRAVRGQMCRDLRQSAVKGDAEHELPVTLCRRDFGAGLYVWVIGDADQ